jgi:hypothetical protein
MNEMFKLLSKNLKISISQKGQVQLGQNENVKVVDRRPQI